MTRVSVLRNTAEFLQGHRARSLSALEVKLKVLAIQLCLTLCDPMDCSPPGSCVRGDSPGNSWSGLPFPSPRGLLDPGVQPRFPALQADSLPSEPPGKPKGLRQSHPKGRSKKEPMSRIMPRMAFWADLGIPAPGISESNYPCPCRREGVEQRPHHSLLGKECLRQKSL